MEEVEGPLGFGADAGEVFRDPCPGQGRDFAVAELEVSIWVRDHYPGSPAGLRRDDIGLVVLSDPFNLPLCTVAPLVSATITFEARYLHHDFHSVA